MKFSKFVKSLAPDGGAIYEYMDERWLASPSVLMLIPDGIRSVTGYSNEKMPDGIGRLIPSSVVVLGKFRRFHLPIFSLFLPNLVFSYIYGIFSMPFGGFFY